MLILMLRSAKLPFCLKFGSASWTACAFGHAKRAARMPPFFTPGSCIACARFLLCCFLLQFFLSILFKAVHRGVHISYCQQKMNKLSGNKSGNQREYTCQSPRSNKHQPFVFLLFRALRRCSLSSQVTYCFSKTAHISLWFLADALIHFICIIRLRIILHEICCSIRVVCRFAASI